MVLASEGELEFQFYKVRLKHERAKAANMLRNLFQFYKVRLKQAPEMTIQTCLNTFQFYKVRLKRTRRTAQHHPPPFQFYKVRLKQFVLNNSFLGGEISILQSSIKTVHRASRRHRGPLISILQSSIKTWPHVPAPSRWPHFNSTKFD